MAFEAGGGGGSGVYTTGDINDAYIANRPPHRHLISPTPWGGTIRRGMIRAHGTEFKHLPNGVFAFHFNPERINLTYQPFPGDPLAEMNAAAEGLPPGQVLGTYNVSFVILLNRQYDVAADPQGNRGTLHDVDVLLGLVGWQDYLTARVVSVVFSPEFSFSGRVTGLNVTHHQFSHRMVPVWTTIDISLSNMPEAVALGGASASFGYGGTSAQPQNTPGASLGLSPNSGRLE